MLNMQHRTAMKTDDIILPEPARTDFDGGGAGMWWRRGAVGFGVVLVGAASLPARSPVGLTPSLCPVVLIVVGHIRLSGYPVSWAALAGRHCRDYRAKGMGALGRYWRFVHVRAGRDDPSGSFPGRGAFFWVIGVCRHGL